MAEAAGTTEEIDFPKGWRFDEDGAEVRGTFVKFDLGQTQEYGNCPIVVLDVGGEERSVWLFHTALRSKFEKEVNRREFVVGERVNIKQAGEKMGANKRKYMNYLVAFPDAPPIDAKSIFGVTPSESTPVQPVADEDLPESDDWAPGP